MFTYIVSLDDIRNCTYSEIILRLVLCVLITWSRVIEKFPLLVHNVIDNGEKHSKKGGDNFIFVLSSHIHYNYILCSCKNGSR